MVLLFAAGGVSRAKAREGPPAAGAKRLREIRRAVERAAAQAARWCAEGADLTQARSDGQPSVTSMRCVLESEVKGMEEGEGEPSRVIEAMPRVAPCGLWTVSRYCEEW